MEPNKVGRLLGIGTRMAAGKLRDGTRGAVAAVERASAAPPAASTQSVAVRPVAPAASKPPAPPPVQPRTPVPSSAAMADGGRRLARGAGRFGASLWKPFAHATSILTLQITGLLFAFFALGFGAKCWQLYKTSGWTDRHLALYLIFAALFAWFAVTSFWRAARKGKRH